MGFKEFEKWACQAVALAKYCPKIKTAGERMNYKLGYKTINSTIKCPLCKIILLPRYKPRGLHGMATIYWYCFKCKLSILKTVRKADEWKY